MMRWSVNKDNLQGDASKGLAVTKQVGAWCSCYSRVPCCLTNTSWMKTPPPPSAVFIMLIKMYPDNQKKLICPLNVLNVSIWDSVLRDALKLIGWKCDYYDNQTPNQRSISDTLDPLLYTRQCYHSYLLYKTLCWSKKRLIKDFTLNVSMTRMIWWRDSWYMRLRRWFCIFEPIYNHVTLNILFMFQTELLSSMCWLQHTCIQFVPIYSCKKSSMKSDWTSSVRHLCQW